jgi:hypothetical protein
VVERQNGTGLHLARHWDEPEGGGGLCAKRRERNGKKSDPQKEPRCAAGDSVRDVDHSVLLLTDCAACVRFR